MFSEAEKDHAKRDLEEAQKAGLEGAHKVEWLSTEETQNVEYFLLTRIRVLTLILAIRRVLSVLSN